MAVVAKSKTPLVVPAADDEYSPAQRRVIDARLKTASKGPYYGPLDSTDEAITLLKKEIRSRKTGKPKRARP